VTSQEVPIVPTQSPARISIDTKDPEEAHGYLQTTYVEHSVRLSGKRDDFRFRHHITDGGNFFVARYEHSMNCRVDTDPFGYLLVGQMFHGKLRLQAGHDELAPAVGELFLLDPAQPMRIHWDDFRAGLVKLDLDVVQRVAAEAGGDPTRPVRFGLSRAASGERVRQWQELVRYVTQDFCTNDLAYSSPLIYSHTMRLLAATLLETFPNTTTTVDPARPGNADASAVRRAVAFIEDHAGEPIGLTEIAAAARIGSRTVQEAFRRHLATTPMAYLRRVRLERAHRELQSADPAAGATVAEIAVRWGFAHHGRFAALYQSCYGQAPSVTLRG
jgi:AraC-like DNA-binding protein